MGSAPSGWQTPKTNWIATDALGTADMNRIEGNTNAIESGDRTIDPAQSPTGNVGTLRQLLDWLANRVGAIIGGNWYDSPPITLTQANAKFDGTTGHKHTGAAGDAPQIGASGIADGAGSGLDADLLDGQHGSYYASVSSLTSHSSATTNVHGLPAATSLVGSKQGTLRLEVQSHTRTGLLNGGHDFSVEWSSPFSSAPKVWVWMEKTGGSSTVNPGWYARSLGGPTTTGHSVRISVDDWPGDGRDYTFTVYFLAIGS